MSVRIPHLRFFCFNPKITFVESLRTKMLIFLKSLSVFSANLNVFKSNIAIHMTLIGGSSHNNKRRNHFIKKNIKRCSCFSLQNVPFFSEEKMFWRRHYPIANPNKIFKLHFSFGTFKWLLKFHQKC